MVVGRLYSHSLVADVEQARVNVVHERVEYVYLFSGGATLPPRRWREFTHEDEDTRWVDRRRQKRRFIAFRFRLEKRIRVANDDGRRALASGVYRQMQPVIRTKLQLCDEEIRARLEQGLGHHEIADHDRSVAI